MKLIDGDSISEADADLATHPIIQEKYTPGYFADKFDKDAQIHILEIDRHQRRVRRGTLSRHTDAEEPCDQATDHLSTAGKTSPGLAIARSDTASSAPLALLYTQPQIMAIKHNTPPWIFK